MWIEPIVDRTEADVKNKTPKGYCNYTDLQRIEQDAQYLAAELGVILITKNWSMTDFPQVNQLQRIIDNVQTVRSAYFVYQTTPPTPSNPLNTYQKLNAIEQILADVYTLLSANKSARSYAGEIYAGQGIGVI